MASPAGARPSAPPSGAWRVWIDTGGTFTDCLAIDPSGAVHRAKVLSTSALRGRAVEVVDSHRFRVEAPWRVGPDFFSGCTLCWLGASGDFTPLVRFDPERNEIELASPHALPELGGLTATFEIRSPEEAPVLAARLVTGTAMDSQLPPMQMRLATTHGTNALLERKGARVALFITGGFADLLEIATQQRADLFALQVRKPHPLHETTVEVSGRLGADGRVLAPLDLEAVERAARGCVARGIRSAAVALMHGYRDSRSERQVGEVLRDAGFRHVSLSGEIAPRIGLLARAQTAVVDAYLAPMVGGYLDRVAAGGVTALHVMTSAGGLLERSAFRAKDALLSGPAGGVVGAVESAARSGVDELIAFDMGGTSTDVSRYAGRLEYSFEHAVGDATVVAPALRIETVAAGGGSICDTDGLALRVGPDSAGANPGPACYGAGGPLTLTDVNLLLGRLRPERFGIPIVVAAAEQALDRVLGRLAARESREEVLQGFLRIANERMAEAIRRISVREGYDPRSSTLLAFGGAGGQHASAVADLLGMQRVLVPRDAGLLSALGLGSAVIERFAEQQVLLPLDERLELPRRLGELEAKARADVAAQGVPESAVTLRRRIAGVRLLGQDAALQIELSGENVAVDEVDTAFRRAYREIYGYPAPPRGLEVDSLRVVAAGGIESGETAPSETPARPLTRAGSNEQGRAFFDGGCQVVPLFQRSELSEGQAFRGPALVLEAHSSTVVEPGWHAVLDRAGALVLWRPDATRVPG
ncbi:MAG: hydantoinase/oxoprolinase family protein [Acidobacteriota bacterium]